MAVLIHIYLAVSVCGFFEIGAHCVGLVDLKLPMYTGLAKASFGPLSAGVKAVTTPSWNLFFFFFF